MTRKQDYEDALVWIREFRAEHRELRERIVEMRVHLRSVELDSMEPVRRKILFGAIADLLGDTQTILDGES